MLLATCCVALVPPSGSAATSSSVVGATVPSAAWIDTLACASDTTGVTDFGVLLAGSSTVTPLDCTVEFGSSNDTAMLRLYQGDGYGNAMWRPATGPLDTDTGDGDSFSTDGYDNRALASGDVRSIYTQRVGSDAGGVLAAGKYRPGATDDPFVLRWNPDGTPDMGFGAGGVATLDTGSNDAFISAVEDPTDGSILGSGWAAGSGDGLLARFTAGGVLDTSFSAGDGTDGYVVDTAGAGYYNEVEVLDDGSILVACSCNGEMSAIKYHADGTVDTSFGTSGVASTGQAGMAHDLEVLPNGDIIAVGMLGGIGIGVAINDSVVAKFTSTGAPVLGFGGGGTGYWTQDMSGTATADELHDAAILPDGRIVASGRSNPSGSMNGMLVMLSTAGTLDLGFNGTGYRIEQLGGMSTEYWSLSADPDGMIVAGGFGGNAGELDTVVARFTPSGGYDPDFNGGTPVFWGDSPTDHDTTFAGHAPAADGKYVFASNGGGGVGVYRYDSVRVADYANGTTDWDQGANAFGVCLRSVANGASADWTAGPGSACPATDGAYWNAIPAAAPGAKVASIAAPDAEGGATDPMVNLRFGFRTAVTQAPGDYVAPIVFETIAPDA